MAKEPPKRDIERIAKAVRERRELLGLSQDLSPYGGPKRNLVGGFETRGIWPRLPQTRTRWAKALQWEPGAFDKLLAGEEPEELHSSGPRISTDSRLDELERMRSLLDDAIADHRPSGGARIRESMIAADAAAAILERVLDDARIEFLKLLNRQTELER